MGHSQDLIAARLNLEELRAHIGCDSIGFLSREGMMRAIGRPDGYCTACFTGEYPIQISSTNGKSAFEGAIG